MAMLSRLCGASIATVVLGGGLTAAHAEPRAPRGHSVAISFSPIHLAAPIAELQVEILVHEAVSVAVIGGAGQLTAKSSSGDTTFNVYEVGAQVRGYFVGTTEEGAFAGAEVLYLSLDSDDFEGGATGVGVGTEFAAIGGYKWTWDHFFLDLNGGIGYVLASAEATSDGETSNAEDWSF